MKCNDAIRSDTDPECASEDEINEWLDTKMIAIDVI